jgi:hypothetical protein
VLVGVRRTRRMSGVEAVSFGDVVLLSWEVGLAVSEGVSSGPVVRQQEQLMLFGVGVAVEHVSSSLSDLKINYHFINNRSKPYFYNLSNQDEQQNDAPNRTHQNPL